MDEGCGLQRLPRSLLGQPVSRELPQFVVDQGQKLLGGERFTRHDWRQWLREIGHKPWIIILASKWKVKSWRLLSGLQDQRCAIAS
jgi:hypothetical protein